MKDLNKNNKGTWKKDLRLYVHVPFCVKKCNYCDFLSCRSSDEEVNLYFDALYKEIRSYKDRVSDYRVTSVFIGGGTPSCVDSEKIVRTLEELRNVFDFANSKNEDNNIKDSSIEDSSIKDSNIKDSNIKDTNIKDICIYSEPEITIEVNPGTIIKNESGSNDKLSAAISSNKLLDYKRAGINRISFGLQSTHDHELKLLGRIHSYAQFEDNFMLARELGFDNINIDLMSALPGQNLKAWEENLLRIVQLKPEHISAYSLIIEEGTPFYDLYGPEGKLEHLLPSEELDREIYARTKEILLSFGYERYEISNYALKGYECKHNLGYWERDNYLGFGLGAASLIENTRFQNTDNIQEYINLINAKNIITKNVNTKSNSNTKIISNTNDINNLKVNKTKDMIQENNPKDILDDVFCIRRDITVLTKKQQMEEFMFLGLRKTKGISKKDFVDKFGVPIEDIYGDVLVKLSEEGLICTDNDRVCLTDYGLDVSNMVFAEFLFD